MVGWVPANKSGNHCGVEKTDSVHTCTCINLTAFMLKHLNE